MLNSEEGNKVKISMPFVGILSAMIYRIVFEGKVWLYRRFQRYNQ